MIKPAPPIGGATFHIRFDLGFRFHRVVLAGVGGWHGMRALDRSGALLCIVSRSLFLWRARVVGPADYHGTARRDLSKLEGTLWTARPKPRLQPPARRRLDDDSQPLAWQPSAAKEAALMAAQGIRGLGLPSISAVHFAVFRQSIASKKRCGEV